MKKAKKLLKQFKKQKGYGKMVCAWSDEEVIEILQFAINKKCNIPVVSKRSELLIAFGFNIKDASSKEICNFVKIMCDSFKSDL